MARLAHIAAPTFNAKVGIPVAGGQPIEIEFTFKHRTRTELDEFIRTRPGQSDLDTFMAMVVGWGFEDEFSRENAERLLETSIGTALATYRTYIDELIQAKAKN